MIRALDVHPRQYETLQRLVAQLENVKNSLQLALTVALAPHVRDGVAMELVGLSDGRVHVMVPDEEEEHGT